MIAINHVGKCSNPMALVNDNVRIIGYEYPALEGESITFICLSGSSLSGPDSSMCMWNGEWEPDPRDVVCVHELVITGTTTSMSTKLTLHVHARHTVLNIVKFLGSHWPCPHVHSQLFNTASWEWAHGHKQGSALILLCST